MTTSYAPPSLNVLRIFVLAARTGSFKDAAGLLRVTPSAVSQQIKAMEERLGVRLFVRHPRSLSLTREGAQLAEDISPCIDAIELRLSHCAVPRAQLAGRGLAVCQAGAVLSQSEN